MVEEPQVVITGRMRCDPRRDVQRSGSRSSGKQLRVFATVIDAGYLELSTIRREDSVEVTVPSIAKTEHSTIPHRGDHAAAHGQFGNIVDGSLVSTAISGQIGTARHVPRQRTRDLTRLADLTERLIGLLAILLQSDRGQPSVGKPSRWHPQAID